MTLSLLHFSSHSFLFFPFSLVLLCVVPTPTQQTHSRHDPKADGQSTNTQNNEKRVSLFTFSCLSKIYYFGELRLFANFGGRANSEPFAKKCRHCGLFGTLGLKGEKKKYDPRRFGFLFLPVALPTRTHDNTTHHQELPIPSHIHLFLLYRKLHKQTVFSPAATTSTATPSLECSLPPALPASTPEDSQP